MKLKALKFPSGLSICAVYGDIKKGPPNPAMLYERYSEEVVVSWVDKRIADHHISNSSTYLTNHF